MNKIYKCEIRKSDYLWPILVLAFFIYSFSQKGLSWNSMEFQVVIAFFLVMYAFSFYYAKNYQVEVDEIRKELREKVFGWVRVKVDLSKVKKIYFNSLKKGVGVRFVLDEGEIRKKFSLREDEFAKVIEHLKKIDDKIEIFTGLPWLAEV